MNVALVGSNFGLKGYLPVLKIIKEFNLKIICSRNINRLNLKKINGVKYLSEWKDVFKKNIDVLILAVPPKIQEEILIYNLKYKKKIIFEKPISCNFQKSNRIVNQMIKKKIKLELNLTYLNHSLFKKVKKIIYNSDLGSVVNYNIDWRIVSYDFNKRKISWKIDETKGGGLKNIFLTHILSYCEYFFGKMNLISYKIEKKKIKGINFKKKILCKLSHLNFVEGKIFLIAKQKGAQYHKIVIKFENGYIQLFTKSKDWTKDFVLKTYNKKTKKLKFYKTMNNQFFKDGRSNQIYSMLRNFIKKPKNENLIYCLNAEKINKKII